MKQFTKPTVVRQCLAAAKELVVFRPELSETINAELDQIDLSCYKDSMTKLIRADIDELRELIEETIFLMRDMLIGSR